MWNLLSGKRALLVALPVVLLAACVKAEDPGVAVKALQADIVFGVVPPAPAVPPGVQPTVIEVEEDVPDPPASPPRPPAPRPAPQPCPAALETAFPEEAAGPDITTTPKVGSYRWKLGGAVTRGGVRIPLFGFFSRSIENVSPITTSTNRITDAPNESTSRTFTYEQVTPLEGVGGKQVVLYEVKSNPAQQTVPAVPGRTIQVGEPVRGVSLVKITTYDAAGEVTSSFTPTPAVTLLPLKVFSGSDFTSVGVDPATGATLVHSGTVGPRKPVDACGEMVDGWEVTSQEVFTSAAGTMASSYTYIIATQLGGMFVYEKVGPPANAESAVGSDTIEHTIGQVKPTP